MKYLYNRSLTRKIKGFYRRVLIEILNRKKKIRKIKKRLKKRSKAKMKKKKI